MARHVQLHRKRGLERIKNMVREVQGLGMEVCVTLGVLDSKVAGELEGAGSTAYNSNLDTNEICEGLDYVSR